jgi:hypothetical protein
MRLTIDLDKPLKLEIVTAWKSLEKYGQPEGRVSSSGTGVHLKVHGVDMTHDETIPIRLAMGDDKFRAKHDTESKAKPRQMTFTRKGGNVAGEWQNSLERVLQQYDRRCTYRLTLQQRGVIE